MIFDGLSNPLVSPDANGLFTVALDFGVAPFTANQQLWLEITIEGVLPLDPRQALDATPFSLATRGISVDAAGKVGIGTTMPLQRLHIEGGGAEANIRTRGIATRLSLFENDNTDENFEWVVNNGNLFVNELNDAALFVRTQLLASPRTHQ